MAASTYAYADGPNACTTGGKYGIADDNSGDGVRARIAFRTGKADTCGSDSAVLAATGTAKNSCSQFGDKAPTGTVASDYNETTHTLTISDRGGYAAGARAGGDITLKGPGTLYVTHLDMTPPNDFIKVAMSGGDTWTPNVELTGNYSACIRQHELEKVYMDKNLAADSQVYTGVRDSDHVTSETFNLQDDLCHNVLTGKLLAPQPISLPAGVTGTVSKHGLGTTYTGGAKFADGYTLQYVYDDWYYVEGTAADTTLCTSLTVANVGSGTGGTPPSDALTDAWFVDDDLNAQSIQGKVYVPAAYTGSFQVTLVKVQQPGTWGFMMGDDAVIDGPKDTNPIPSYNSGGSTETAAPTINQGQGAASSSYDNGGGPAGARVFYKHGDVIPSSSRGMLSDYWAEEEIEVKTYVTGTGSVTITKTDLERSQGSPPSPIYKFAVMKCNSFGCAKRKRVSLEIQVADIGLYEPKAVFYGDLDPKTRSLQGEITVTAPLFAMGLQGYRLYPTANGNDNLALTWSDTKGVGTDDAQLSEDLDKSCPPDTKNTDQKAGTDARYLKMAKEPCGNDNPYSPKCIGKSCTHVNILGGSAGEFYISRFDNIGNRENPATVHSSKKDNGLGTKPHDDTSNTAQRNYSDNEYAVIYLPSSGWLTPIMMDLPDPSDTLKAYQGATDTTGIDLKAEPLSTYVDLLTEESEIKFITDKYHTGHGFTLIWQPDYPEVEFASPGLPMAQGAAGFRVVSVYGDQGSQDVTTDKDLDGETVEGKRTSEKRPKDTVADTYVETLDWLVPNVTCTPTTMHCPLPTTWAHINYTTPSLYPEPAEGSCLQQKTGTSSLAGCGEKKNLNTRWYSANSPATSQPGNSQQNTDEEDNGQLVADDTAGLKHANWAGNCGDASSYFWFEKIACGSTRTFLTDRSLIEDFVQLTPLGRTSRPFWTCTTPQRHLSKARMVETVSLSSTLITTLLQCCPPR
jgi:hypothetical protein